MSDTETAHSAQECPYHWSHPWYYIHDHTPLSLAELYAAAEHEPDPNYTLRVAACCRATRAEYNGDPAPYRANLLTELHRAERRYRVLLAERSLHPADVTARAPRELGGWPMVISTVANRIISLLSDIAILDEHCGRQYELFEPT